MIIDNYKLKLVKQHSSKKNKDYYALILVVDNQEILLSFVYNNIAEQIFKKN